MATRHWVGGLEMPQGPSPCLAFHEVLGQGWHIPLFFRYISVSFVRFWGFWRSLFITFARTFGTQLCRCKKYPETILALNAGQRRCALPWRCSCAMRAPRSDQLGMVPFSPCLHACTCYPLHQSVGKRVDQNWWGTSETFFQEQRNLTDDFKPEGTRALIHPSNHLVL